LVGRSPEWDPDSNSQNTNKIVIAPHHIEYTTILIWFTPKKATKGITKNAGKGGLGTYHCPW